MVFGTFVKRAEKVANKVVEAGEGVTNVTTDVTGKATDLVAGATGGLADTTITAFHSMVNLTGKTSDVMVENATQVAGVLSQSAGAVAATIGGATGVMGEGLNELQVKMLGKFSSHIDGRILYIQEKLDLEEAQFSEIMGVFTDVLDTIKKEWIVDADGGFSLTVGTDRFKDELATMVLNKLEESGILNHVAEAIAEMIVLFIVELIVFALIGHILELYGISPEVLDLISLLINLMEIEQTLEQLTPVFDFLNFMSPRQ